MYALGVLKDFTASHFLIGGDWGEETLPTLTTYRVEIQVSGVALDEHEYLADIVKLQRLLEEQIGRYRDRMLNELSEFDGLNPSVELLAKNLCKGCAGGLRDCGNLNAVRVKVWENEIAWASYAEKIRTLISPPPEPLHTRPFFPSRKWR